jgi:hypothetical protein
MEILNDNVSLVRKIEKYIIKILINGKKFIKYERNRDAFFADSKSRFARMWTAFVK